MPIYAGIDEAGYGPMFGPMVVARCVFEIPSQEESQPPVPCLWNLLRQAVCRRTRDRRNRIAVNDSKKLYPSPAGLRHLERGVLSFAALAGHLPSTVQGLTHALGHDPESGAAPAWYTGGVAQTFPGTLAPDELAIAAAFLKREAASVGVALLDLSAAVVYEDRFNRLTNATRSKASCAWTFVAQHLWAIWQRFGPQSPWVVVDRQGGRSAYHPLLQMIFPDAQLKQTQESDQVSRYHLRENGRQMTVSFEIESEPNHLPAALASMTAKYLRELAMARFNAFWRSHAPDLRPTAGYVQDGRRFLAQIEPLMEQLGIKHDALVRCR